MTDIGFSCGTEFDHETAVTAAAEFDCEFIELLMEGDYERRTCPTEGVRTACERHGVDLLVHLPLRLPVGSPHEHIREGAVREAVDALETASAMGARRAVLHARSDAWSPGYDREQVRDLIIRGCDAVSERSPEDVEMCVENLTTPFFDIDDFRLLFDRTDASMTLDTGHALVQGYDEDTQAELIHEYPERVRHVHLNDTRTTSDDEHLPIGAGAVDFEPILTAVESEATLTCEMFTFSLDYIETSVEHVRELAAKTGST